MNDYGETRLLHPPLTCWAEKDLVHGMHQLPWLHVDGQVGRMQPQVMWVWGRMRDKESHVDVARVYFNNNYI